jgi:DNA-binding NarL/FixJ family response regulator
MLRVVVVEKRQAVRDGLKRLLAVAGEITVVGEADGVVLATEIAQGVDCDLLVVGMAVLGHEAHDDIRRLKLALPALHLLAVGPAAVADESRETLAQGASGYLDMSRAREDLVRAVRTVCRGNLFVSPSTKAPRRGPAPAAG